MALVSRSVRRGSTGRRWVVAGIVVALFVLLIDASLHSRSSGPDKQLATGAWVDRALPLVTSSTEEGQQLAAVWTDGLRMPVRSLSAQLDQIAAGAASAYRQASALRAPDDLVGPGGLLDASLLSRSDAATAVRDALNPVVLGHQPAGAAALAAITAAGQDLQVGDQAYRLFLQSMPNVGVAMPSSVVERKPGAVPARCGSGVSGQPAERHERYARSPGQDRLDHDVPEFRCPCRGMYTSCRTPRPCP